MLRPLPHPHDSRRLQPGLSESTISKIAGIVIQSKGATLTEAARLLAVSRVTAIRWLALMESEGLLVRTQVMSGRRGRPQGIYRPTDKLMKLVEAHNSGSIAILGFPTLKGACKHLVEGDCGFQTKAQPCGAAICPLRVLFRLWGKSCCSTCGDMRNSNPDSDYGWFGHNDAAPPNSIGPRKLLCGDPWRGYHCSGANKRAPDSRVPAFFSCKIHLKFGRRG